MKAYIFSPQKRRRRRAPLFIFNYLYTKLNGCEFTYSPKGFKAKLSKKNFFSNTIDEKGRKATAQVQGA
jgi:hypothetical protein